jgi:hypothetical protein
MRYRIDFETSPLFVEVPDEVRGLDLYEFLHNAATSADLNEHYDLFGYEECPEPEASEQ